MIKCRVKEGQKGQIQKILSNLSGIKKTNQSGYIICSD